MQDARALLDSLMGPSRDKGLEEQQKGDGWKEKNVCKRYLVGFCPNSAQDNWFRNTRRKDIAVCEKVHSDRLRADFQKHRDYEKFRLEYEREFLNFLEGLVREADAWIAREQSNCAAPGKVTKMPAKVRQNVEELKEASEKLMRQAEDLAEKGLVAESKLALEMSNEKKAEAKEIKEKHTYQSEGERVCQICGVRCNPDEPADFQAHLDGRLHEGYSKIREEVKQLRDKARSLPATRTDKEKEKDRGKDKDRDTDKDKQKDKEKEKDTEKSKEKAKEKEKEKDKDKDSKDKDKEKKEAKSKDKGKDKDKKSKSRRKETEDDDASGDEDDEDKDSYSDYSDYSGSDA